MARLPISRGHLSGLTDLTVSSLLHRRPGSTITKNNFLEGDATVFETLSRYQTLGCVRLHLPPAGSARPMLPVKRIGRPRVPVGAVVDFQDDYFTFFVGYLACVPLFGSRERLIHRHALTYALLTLTLNPNNYREAHKISLQQCTYLIVHILEYFRKSMKLLGYIHYS